mmetsp:Transcript_18662/g.34576  ORF Transcript_18662/g.34576 Transcript_18662/m.34576 type:complete len:214 (-) Transcript_18662:42-683(-)
MVKAEFLHAQGRTLGQYELLDELMKLWPQPQSETDHGEEEGSDEEDLPSPFDAARRGNVEVIKVWLALQGGDNSSQAINQMSETTGRTLLQEAVGAKQLDTVRWLLGHPRINVHKGSRLGRSTALHIAALVGSSEAVELLLEAGADLHMRDRAGQQAIHLASTPAAAETLLRRGADSLAIDRRGATPIQCAVMGGYNMVYKTLRDFVARTDVS